MAEFAYNNTKNASIGHTSFKLNYKYYFYVSYEKDFNSCSKSKTVKKLSFELRELISVYQQNLHYAQKYLKQAHNKSVKSRSYASGDKVWLNSKHLKIKQNCILEAKFLDLFWVLHRVGK